MDLNESVWLSSATSSRSEGRLETLKRSVDGKEGKRKGNGGGIPQLNASAHDERVTGNGGR